MSGIYNSFQIKLNGADGNAIKEIIEKTIKENNYRFLDDELVWGNVELSFETLNAEEYLGFDYDDLETSRSLFLLICESIMKKYPDGGFIGRHSFDYSNVDHCDYLYIFCKNGVLTAYEGETNDGEGYLTARASYEFKDGQLSEIQKFDYDAMETEEEFALVYEAFDNDEYPVLPEEELPEMDKIAIPPEEDISERLGKHKLIEGRFYRVEYDNYGTKKEIIGQLQDYFPKTYVFENLGSNTDYIEERDINNIVEVYETEATHKIRADYEHINQEIERGEEEQKKLRESFYSLYTAEGENWERKPLVQIDIGESYPGIEGIEAGKTYLVKVKKSFSVVGTDVVLVVNCMEDPIGIQFRCLTCDPSVSTAEISFIRPVVASNLDEFTEELLIGEDANQIQKARIEQYNKVNSFHGQLGQLRKDYPASFSE